MTEEQINSKKDYTSKYKNSIVVDTSYPNVIVDIDSVNIVYKIIEILPDGKYKVRRRSVGTPVKKATKRNPKHDMFGNQLFKPFPSYSHARENAANFVKNFLKLTITDE